METASETISPATTPIWALVAAKWWAEQVRGGARQNNGDGFQSMVLTFVVGQESQGASYIFEADLAALIVSEHKRLSAFGIPDVTLRTDYGAEYPLSEVARKHQVGALPIKTSMYISPFLVSVAAGYGASDEILWFATDSDGNRIVPLDRQGTRVGSMADLIEEVERLEPKPASWEASWKARRLADLRSQPTTLAQLGAGQR